MRKARERRGGSRPTDPDDRKRRPPPAAAAGAGDRLAILIQPDGTRYQVRAKGAARYCETHPGWTWRYRNG